ncbi:MAG: GntR family transcriptional regulator [Actinomycetota bacterium]|jgi:GntR family transcriptional regulator|nr:GntR family transcriptional regulator [Actinomycetota bacterium]
MEREAQDPASSGDPRPRLWATVLADLRVRLANGEFAERFPTDKELTAQYGVSRHTAREAVRRLDVVARRPRLGGRIRRPQGTLENLGVTLRALGVQLELTESTGGRHSPRPAAAAIGFESSEAMDVVVSVLLADGEPLLVSELWLPRGSPLEARDVGPLLGLAAQRDGIEVADESVLPAVATKQTCGALKLPGGAAVFCAEQVIQFAGQVAGWHRALIRPERYRCIVRWEPTSGS